MLGKEKGRKKLEAKDGISEENTQTLRISLGGASALTGHRQDARLVRIDAAHCAASFEFGLRPWR